MFRIILIILVILISIPIFNKGRDYFNEKMRKVEVLGTTAKKAIKYGAGDK